jgi:hypothetical protein
MTSAPVLTSRIDVELPEWLVVPEPAAAAVDWRDEVLRLFDTIAQVDRDAEGEQRLFADGSEVDPRTAVANLLEFREALGDDGRLVAGLHVPNRWPLPVVVSVGVADPEGPDLLELAGAGGGKPVERPAVDELPEHVGGEGPIVTRYDLDDEGVIWASVCAVRRERLATGEGGPDVAIDTRVLWRTNDLDLVPVFGPSLIELLAAVQNAVDEGNDA